MKAIMVNADYKSMSIAARILSSRKQKKLTQDKLAMLIGVSKSACGQWEHGLTSPSVENLSRLAIVLEVQFEWLATGRGERDFPPELPSPKISI